MGQISQLRDQTNAIARQPPPGIALRHMVDQAMHTVALIIETQIGLAMQQVAQIQVRLFADQFQVKTIGLAECFLTVEAVDLKVAGHPVQGQGESTLIGRREHPMFLCEGWGADSAPVPRLAEQRARKSVKPYERACESSVCPTQFTHKKGPLSVGCGPFV